MNVVFVGKNVLDRDEISSTQEHAQCLELNFRNGDTMSLPWRDEYERRDILSCFDGQIPSPGAK